MFNLLIFPTEAQLERIKKKYPDLNANNVITFLMLLRAASELSSGLDKLLMKHGLLSNRWLILVLLMRQENQMLSPSDLTKALGITGATLSRLLDSLDEEGYIKRTVNKSDRRAKEIHLTPKGDKILNKVMPEYYKAIDRVMHDLSDGDHKTLAKTLTAIDASRFTTEK